MSNRFRLFSRARGFRDEWRALKSKVARHEEEIASLRRSLAAVAARGTGAQPRVREASGPLRVLAYNAEAPLLCETYVEEELEALAANGAEIAYCRKIRPPAEPQVDRPLYTDLAVALAEFAPHVLFLHWAWFADNEWDALEALGMPFGVRVHSFDFDPQTLQRLLDHPNCIGVWAYPHAARQVPGTLELPSMFTSVDRLPEPRAPRDAVMSMSAGLPKKDWDVLLGAFGDLAGARRRVVLAHTDGNPDLPERVMARAARLPDPPEVLVDVQRSEVFGLLSETSVVLYTLDPGVRNFGNPMSIVEALCAGASIVVPDRPEAVAFAGPHPRAYRTREDIVRHVREVLAGGPKIEAEHEDNREYGRSTFCDPAVGKRFFAELSEAVDRWYASREASRPS
jgi:glycosyltransferase involved in cell wall biosynthesis